MIIVFLFALCSVVIVYHIKIVLFCLQEKLLLVIIMGTETQNKLISVHVFET